MKKFKGKEIEKNKFKNVVNEEFNQEYDGFVDVVTGRPHGEGTLTVRNKDKTLWEIEEGIFQDGFLTEGSETTYLLHDDRNFIKKVIGKWRFDKDKNFCEESISGKGEELYYRTEKDLKNNKYFGSVSGTFKNGTLIKGKITNAFSIKYVENKNIKHIHYENSRDSKNSPFGIVWKGKIFYNNGDRYEGEMLWGTPEGRGRYHHKILHNLLSGKWINGELQHPFKTIRTVKKKIKKK